jgi:WD40 repeat protein
MAFAADSKQLVSAGLDGCLRFWDAETGRELQHANPAADFSLTGNPWVSDLTVSRDGTFVAVNIMTYGVFLYEVKTGKALRRVGDKLNAGYSGIGMLFTPDGKQILLSVRAQGETGAHVFETETGEELRQIEGHENVVYCADFSADGKTLVTGSDDQSVRLWQFETGKEIRNLEGHRSGLASVAISADGKRVASLSSDERLLIWDAETGKENHCITIARSSFNSTSPGSMLRFSADGKILNGFLGDGVHQWDVGSGKEVRVPKDTTRDGYGCTMSPDGKFIARLSTSNLGRIALLDGTTEKELFSNQSLSTLAIAISPDGKYLATGGNDRIVHLRDMTSLEEVKRFEGHSGSISFLQFADKGKTLLSASKDYYDRTISSWEVETGKERRMIRTGASVVIAYAASSDGETLAFLYQNQGLNLRAMNTATGKETRNATLSVSALGFALTPDGKAYITHAPDGSMQITDLLEGKPRPLVKGFRGASFVSPDSKTVAIISEKDGLIHLVNLSTGRDFRQLGDKANADAPARVRPSVQGSQPVLAFSSDGRVLAGAGKDGAIEVWEIAGGKQRCSFHGSDQTPLSALAFTPDSTTLISASHDGLTFIWDLVKGSKEEQQLAGTLNEKQLNELWGDLANDDGAKAYRAMRILRAAPKVSLPFLKEHLKPAVEVEQKAIEKLIADLDSAEFETRTRATEQLEKLGEIAEPHLRKTLKADPSQEMVKRLEELIEKLELATASGDKLCGLRAVEILEHTATSDAVRLLETLAAGAEADSVTREAKAAVERRRVAENK